MMMAEEREKEGKLSLSFFFFFSTSNTGSAQDSFQEILDFSRLIKLWQGQEELESKVCRSWAGKAARG